MDDTAMDIIPETTRRRAQANLDAADKQHERNRQLIEQINRQTSSTDQATRDDRPTLRGANDEEKTPTPTKSSTPVEQTASPPQPEESPSTHCPRGNNTNESHQHPTTLNTTEDTISREAGNSTDVVPIHPHGANIDTNSNGDEASRAPGDAGYDAAHAFIQQQAREEHAPDGWMDLPNGLLRLDQVILETVTVEAIREHLPGLGDRSHWGLMLWSVFGERVHASVDKSGRTYQRVMIPAKLLARLEGKLGQYESKHYVARTFLEAHRQVVPAFEYTGWQRDAYPRQVRSHGLPLGLLELMRRDLLTPIDEMEAPVWALTGTPLPDRSTGKAAQRRAEKRDMRRSAAQHWTRERSVCDLQARLLRYLNDRDPRLYARRFGQTLPSAMKAVMDLPESDVALEERLRALKTLQAVQLRPEVYYQPSRRGRTARVFSLGESMLGLPSEVRSALLGGALHGDLANAQLAIAAAEWDIKPLHRYLVEGDWMTSNPKIWPYVFEKVGYLVYEGVATEYRQHDAVKSALKRAIYAIVFGMRRSGVRWMLWQSFSPSQVASFMRSPIIEATFTARRRVMAAIDERGYAEDCFGNSYPVTADEPADRKEEVRSALASVMQAWELKLLEPVINDAIRETEKASRPAYQVIAWLHDGFALAVSKNKASIERRMKRLVQKQADRLGIPTYLETEWL